MPKKGRMYPPEFRRQMVELVRAGRTAEELSREFEPSAQAIRNWVKQAELDEGKRADGLTSRGEGGARAADPSQRSWGPVPFDSLHRAAGRGRHRALGGKQGRQLRQCVG